jgi:putative hydrolase of the HAD superfamily
LATTLRAVTFDVWETLIHDAPGLERRRIAFRSDQMSALLREAGLPVSPEALVAAYEGALPEMEAVWSASRDFDTPTQVGYLLARLPVPPNVAHSSDLAASLSMAYARATLAHPPTLGPDTKSTLAEVARRGLRIGLICNTGRTPGWILRDLFESWGILRYFEALAFSNEVGIRKPEPAIFHGVLSGLGVSSDHAMHVGDDPLTDIAGAKAIGMRAAMIGPAGRSAPVPPDARIARLGELIPVIDRLTR